MRYICTAVVATLALVGTSFAATINVPGDYATIQGAINASVNGDIISIAAGTYYEYDVNPGVKAITISGAVNKDGSPAVTLDAEEQGRVIYMPYYGVAILENLVLQNGYSGNNGGAMKAESDSSPTITNCTFRNSEAGAAGGLLVYGTATIVNCRFENNIATWNIGGLYTRGGVVTDCTFTGNACGNDGGALAVEFGGVTTITNCVFEGNTAGATGGAIQLWDATQTTIDNCTITGNAAGTGGGINHDGNSDYVLSNSTVCGNTPDQIVGEYTDGGGNTIYALCSDEDGTLHVPSEYPTIQGAIDVAIDGHTVLIAAGTYYESGLNLDGKDIYITGTLSKDGSLGVTIDAELNGGAIYCDSDATFENLLITHGSADDGGGMYVSGASPTLTNCTLTNNTAKNGGGMFNDSSSPTLIDCTVSNNGAVYWQEDGTGRGGGICNVGSVASLSNTTVSDNSGSWGGGICNMDGSVSSLTACTVSNNIGKISGGGIYSVLSYAALEDNVFCSNEPTDLVGAWKDLGGNTFSDDCDSDPGLCGGDTNQDYNVDVLDMLYILAVWGTSNPAGDINEDGIVDVSDLLEVIGNWGPCP